MTKIWEQNVVGRTLFLHENDKKTNLGRAK